MKKMIMKSRDGNRSIQLWENQVVSIDMQALQIHCVQGSLWVTWPDGNDRVLRKGQALQVVSKGRICMQAFSNCAVMVEQLSVSSSFSIMGHDPLLANRSHGPSHIFRFGLAGK